MGEALQITVNGRAEQAGEGLSVDGFVRERYGSRPVVVEHNGRPLRREELEEVRLIEGDRLEVVELVGGG